MNKPTSIDVLELYHAALDRKCAIRVVQSYKHMDDGKDFFIEIKEGNGVTYVVVLFPNTWWTTF